MALIGLISTKSEKLNNYLSMNSKYYIFNLSKVKQN